jgi:hypothetical protein
MRRSDVIGKFLLTGHAMAVGCDRGNYVVMIDVNLGAGAA